MSGWHVPTDNGRVLIVGLRSLRPRIVLGFLCGGVYSLQRWRFSSEHRFFKLCALRPGLVPVFPWSHPLHGLPVWHVLSNNGRIIGCDLRKLLARDVRRDRRSKRLHEVWSGPLSK